MGNIDWLPIAELPEAFKDGRDLLVWEREPVILQWHNGWWADNGLTHIDEPTHFAEINAP